MNVNEYSLKMVFMNQRLQINLMHIPSIRIFLCFSLFGFILRALFPIDVSQICLQSSLLKWWKALLGSSISEKKTQTEFFRTTISHINLLSSYLKPNPPFT